MQLRPLLVGMCNPHSDDPVHALYPYPSGVAGHRLWKLLTVTRPDVSVTDYIERFDRTNLLGREAAADWDPEAARLAAMEMVPKLHEHGKIVLLGAAVRSAFAPFLPGVKNLQPCEMTLDHARSTSIFYLPHPSDLCRWYNDDANRRLASVVLSNLYGE